MIDISKGLKDPHTTVPPHPPETTNDVTHENAETQKPTEVLISKTENHERLVHIVIEPESTEAPISTVVPPYEEATSTKTPWMHGSKSFMTKLVVIQIL